MFIPPWIPKMLNRSGLDKEHQIIQQFLHVGTCHVKVMMAIMAMTFFDK